jgi:hypothetical protein
MDDCWRQHHLSKKIEETRHDHRDHSRDRRKRKDPPSSSASSYYEKEREEWSKKKVSHYGSFY